MKYRGHTLHKRGVFQLKFNIENEKTESILSDKNYRHVLHGFHRVN